MHGNKKTDTTLAKQGIVDYNSNAERRRERVPAMWIDPRKTEICKARFVGELTQVSSIFALDFYHPWSCSFACHDERRRSSCQISWSKIML